jgi:hypothetical protein
MHPCTGRLTEGGEVLEGEGLEVGIVLDGVVLVEPVRLLQQEQDPLERLQLLLGHIQKEPAAEAIQLRLIYSRIQIDPSKSKNNSRDGVWEIPAEIVKQLLWRQLPPR